MNQRKLLIQYWDCAALFAIYCQKILYVLLVVLCFSSKLSAQQGQIWNYPIHYGTTGWEKLKTFGERINAYNIPDSLLKNMTTKDLVETCMHYPNIILIITRDNVQLGYNDLRLMFNGFRELENRKNAGGELIRLYQEIKPEEIVGIKSPDDRGDFSLKLTFLEILLAQKPILQNLNQEEAIQLFSVSNI